MYYWGSSLFIFCLGSKSCMCCSVTSHCENGFQAPNTYSCWRTIVPPAPCAEHLWHWAQRSFFHSIFVSKAQQKTFQGYKNVPTHIHIGRDRPIDSPVSPPARTRTQSQPLWILNSEFTTIYCTIINPRTRGIEHCSVQIWSVLFENHIGFSTCMVIMILVCGVT